MSEALLETARHAAIDACTAANGLVQKARKGVYTYQAPDGLIDPGHLYTDIRKLCDALEAGKAKVEIPEVQNQLMRARGNEPARHDNRSYVTVHALAWDFARSTWCRMRDLLHYGIGPDGPDSAMIAATADDIHHYMDKEDRQGYGFWLDLERLKTPWPDLEGEQEKHVTARFAAVQEILAGIEPLDRDWVTAAMRIESAKAAAAEADTPPATADEATVTPRKKPPAEPSREAFFAYFVYVLGGKTQEETGRLLMETFSGSFPQYKISRLASRVSRWLDAGNKLPAVSEKAPG